MSEPSDGWPRVREVFEQALALPPEARPAFVAAACGSNQRLRDDVERLVASHEGAAGFLSTPAAELLPLASTPSLEGQRIGPYVLLTRLGAGGMGEVYRARDTRLDRIVAIKILPVSARDDRHARDRFDREARAIAALTHPHICALYDVGEVTLSVDPAPDGYEPMTIRYLVMEHLEGDTLAQRLAEGAVPIEQALKYGVQIASALAAAHRAGIVHRDLKPANVMLVKGEAKLLDFGLAKSTRRQPDLPFAPDTITVPGTIVGTLQYMAPEQLEGRDADPRTDVFAFGSVLYELLTGVKAFTGANQLSVGAAILEENPEPLRARLPLAPPALERVVGRCLAKDPDERWQSTSDLASELRWIAQTLGAPGERPVASQPRSTAWSTPARFAAVLAVFTSLALLAAIAFRPAPAAPARGAPKHFVVTIPDYNRIANFALLPDGSGIVYRSDRDYRLHLQTLGGEGSHPIPGTEVPGGSGCIAVSPDASRLAFTTAGGIKKVELTGGEPIEIASSNACVYSWDSDNRISAGQRGGLYHTPSSGGQPEPLTTIAAGEMSHRLARPLPGGRAVVFTVLRKSGVMEDATIEAVSVSTKQRHVLVKGATRPLYSPTGHLMYVRGADLFAVPFDADRLAITGEPVLVLSGVHVGEYLTAQIDLAADGTLAYLPGGGEELERTLLWVDRKGAAIPVPMGQRPYAHFSVLPDRRGLIVEIEGATHNIWHQDLESGVLTPLTTGAGNHRPVLSPDGRFMVYSSDRTNPRSLYVQPTDGSGAAELLADAQGNATSWSPDGRWVVYDSFATAATKTDISMVSMDGEHRARPFLQTRFAEHHATFSPDGHWIAYTSDESGRPEIMVTAFPGPGPRKQVSTNGGSLPNFSRDGRHLFYRLGEDIFDVEMLSPGALAFGPPRPAFAIPNANPNSQLPYPVTSTGNAVLYAKADEGALRRIHVIVNWFEQLKRLTAEK
jgi:serine/threonine protein kinase/Tol biopolymer transport system component